MRRAAPPPRRRLRRLVLSAIALYSVGGVASLTHHPPWRPLYMRPGLPSARWPCGSHGAPIPTTRPDGEEPTDEQPPPAPDGLPELDWGEFERAFRAYTDRSREPAGMS